MTVANQERRLVAMASVLRSVLFLSAYTPLILILAILLWTTSPTFWLQVPFLHVGFYLSLWSVLLLVGGAVSLVLLWLFLRSLRRSEAKRIDVEEMKQKDEQIVSYIVTYAIPFLAAPFESKEKAIGLGIFFVVVWLLQVKLNLLYINPVLAFFDYHLYEVTSSGTTQTLLSKKRRGPTGILRAVKVGDNILFEDESR